MNKPAQFTPPVNEVMAHYNLSDDAWDCLSIFTKQKLATMYIKHAAAPAMYEALKDLIGDLGDLHGGSIAELQCHWCGREYEDQEAGGLCTSDDCPGFKAREALAQAEGR